MLATGGMAICVGAATYLFASWLAQPDAWVSGLGVAVGVVIGTAWRTLRSEKPE